MPRISTGSDEDVIANYFANSNRAISEPDFPGGLLNDEKVWAARQPWLLEAGYRLRPRYQPGWTPKWKGKSLLETERFEDAHGSAFVKLMDATRVSDNHPVMLKLVGKTYHPHEIEIGQFLCTGALASDPRNHSTPVLDVLHPPDRDDALILVTPLYRKSDDPPFQTIGEAVDFFVQIFEGLQFLHEHHVAHRDCNYNNIMMDASSLYPRGFHPVKQNKSLDFSTEAFHFTRTQRPPKYYFIDFGLSRRYKSEDLPVQETIIIGGDKSPPEHQGQSPSADPFPTDVYYLGNLIRTRFLERKRGFEFMAPLVTDMTKIDPAQRPTIDECVKRLQGILRPLSDWTLRARIVDRRELMIAGVVRGITHWPRQLADYARKRPPMGKAQKEIMTT